MIHVEPAELSVQQVHGYLLGGVGPRPIALVSTTSSDGQVNLSPFSFFNAFGANPPIVAFSPSRRVRDNTIKDTLTNVQDTGECVIQAVTHAMVQQISLASAEYPTGVNEFEKCGLTPAPSDIVKPPRVKESPFQMECRIRQIVDFGENKGAGNLVVCEVVKFHIAEDIIENGVIQPDRIDLVARMSANYYCRANGDSIFEVAKPLKSLGLGFDHLPDHIKQSPILTGNHLGQLANCERMPSDDEVREFISIQQPLEVCLEACERFERLGEYESMYRAVLGLRDRIDHFDQLLHRTARLALNHGNTTFAWLALTAGDRD